ncbi:MAG: hypothetical protein IJO74_07350 [Clostridia bacterium]|nr:hypothetical protein [Clostridia bacterium]
MKRHYNRIARGFAYAKFLTLISAVIFTLFAFNLYRNDITIENFRYMIKYLDFKSAESDTVTGTSIVFDSEASTGMLLYRSDVAVLKKNGLELYDLSGQKIFSSSFTMTSPHAVCGDKYLLVFDVGGTYAAVFNTFSKIWETNFEYPIIDASINDQGDFCILTSKKGYKSALYHYNSNFKMTYAWMSGDKYAVDVSMSSKNRDKFILTAIHANDGFFQSDIILLSTESDNAIASVSLYDELVLELSGFKENITVLTDKRILFYNTENLELISWSEFSRDSLSDFVFNQNYSVPIFSKKIIGSENDLAVFSSNGENIHSFNSQEHILDMCISDNKLYQLSSGRLTVFNLDTFEKEVLETDKKYDRLISDDYTVLIACANDAVAVSQR